jgi:hypothetical protein
MDEVRSAADERSFGDEELERRMIGPRFRRQGDLHARSQHLDRG